MFDVNDLRVMVTLISFIVFIGICLWSFYPKNKERFAKASRIPLDDES